MGVYNGSHEVVKCDRCKQSHAIYSVPEGRSTNEGLRSVHRPVVSQLRREVPLGPHQRARYRCVGEAQVGQGGRSISAVCNRMGHHRKDIRRSSHSKEKTPVGSRQCSVSRNFHRRERSQSETIPIHSVNDHTICHSDKTTLRCNIIPLSIPRGNTCEVTPTPSMRRGSLQYMASMGVQLSVLMTLSQHRSETTLLRYLNCGTFASVMLNKQTKAIQDEDVSIVERNPLGFFSMLGHIQCVTPPLSTGQLPTSARKMRRRYTKNKLLKAATCTNECGYFGYMFTVTEAAKSEEDWHMTRCQRMSSPTNQVKWDSPSCQCCGE